MTKKRIFRALAGLLAIALVIGGVFAFTKKSGIVQAESLDLERAVKLKIYTSADNVLGAYVEDKNASGTARWVYKVIGETLRDNGMSLADEDGTKVMSKLMDEFGNMYDTKVLVTDGLGTPSELTKSYIANSGASALFTVKPDLKDTQVIDEKYIAYSSIFSNSKELKELRSLIEDLDKETTSLSETGVSANSDVFLQINTLKESLEAMETLVTTIDNSVTSQLNTVTERVNVITGKDGKDGTSGSDGSDGSNGFDGEDGYSGSDGASAYGGSNAQFEASLVAQYNSITQIQSDIANLQNTLASSNQNEASEISNLNSELETAKQLVEDTKSTIAEQLTTNNTFNSMLSDHAAQLVAQGAKTDAVKSELSTVITTTQTELTTLIQTNQSATNDKINALQTSSSDALKKSNDELNASIASTKKSLEQALNSFIATTNANFDAVSDRIDDLERQLYANTASINSAMNAVIANIDAVDTSQFRSSVISNCSALTSRLVDLRRELSDIADTLDTSKPADANIDSQINGIIAQINVATDMIEEYRSNILTRVDTIDNKISIAKTSYANGDSGAEALLIEAANLLLSAQNAESVYRTEVNTAVSQIMTNVTGIKGHNNLKNTANSLTTAINTLSEEMENSLAQLEANYTEALNNLRSDTNTSLANLEEKLDMTRIGGFEITSADWHIDNSLFGGAGGYYVAITHESINDNSYIDVHYQGNPDIEPTYTGYGNCNETHTIWICNKTDTPVTIRDIFVYNQKVETATTN